MIDAQCACGLAMNPKKLGKVYTKMLFVLKSNRHHTAATVSHRFSEMDRKNTPGFPRYRKSPLSISSVRRLAVWITSALLVTREQRGSVELVRSSNECIGDFESTEEAFCCPDFRVTTWALCIAPPFAKLIRGTWVC